MHSRSLMNAPRARSIKFKKIASIFTSGCMPRTYAAVQLFLKRINRHETHIAGQVLTSSSGENCLEVKRIHRSRDIFIFLIHLPHFLTSMLKANSPCRCITLELRKALRVISPAALLWSLDKLYESYVAAPVLLAQERVRSTPSPTAKID